MEIGKEEPAIIVEPIKDPFPTEAPVPDEPAVPVPEERPEEAPA